MKTTIKIDGMGCLHMWEGDVFPYGRGCTYKVNGEWADLYVQEHESIESILAELTEEEREHLDRGYSVTTENISSDYFLDA